MVSNNPVLNMYSTDFSFGGSPSTGFGVSQDSSLGGWNMNSLFDMSGGTPSSSGNMPYNNFDPFSVMGLNSNYGTGNYQNSTFNFSDPGSSSGNSFSFDGLSYSSSVISGSQENGMSDYENYNAKYGVGGLLSSLGVSGDSGPIAPPSLGNYVFPPPSSGSPPPEGSPPPSSGSPPPASSSLPSGSSPPAGEPPPAGSPPSGSPPPSGQVSDWVAQARKELIAAGVPADKMSEKDIETIIQHESSGDPNAVNNWDYNAQAGTPSQGLMQTIPSTFEAYKLPGHDNITNPVDNIIAGVRYAIDKYGSVSNVPGVVQVNSGGQYVGY